MQHLSKKNAPCWEHFSLIEQLIISSIKQFSHRFQCTDKFALHYQSRC